MKDNEEDNKINTTNYPGMSIAEFASLLGSKSPVPGGGGASALTGALGIALGSMVASLTIGKKKYADVEGEMIAFRTEAKCVQGELLELIRRDAEVFEPLSRAYGLPQTTDAENQEKDRVMAAALDEACSAPLGIMRACTKAIALLEVFAAKGNRLAVSDAGAGALLCKAALAAASLNVFINTKAMKDRNRAEEINRETRSLLEEYEPRAEQVYTSVLAQLR
jgi:formiminotetrahydrofolate cyclodeaminase